MSELCYYCMKKHPIEQDCFPKAIDVVFPESFLLDFLEWSKSQDKKKLPLLINKAKTLYNKIYGQKK